MINIRPIASFRKRVDTVKKIVFTMSSTPSTFSITNTPLRYDKDIAMSLRFDDGYLDAYETALPFFNGGDIVYDGGSVPNYSGLFYTDGCGNDIKFKAELAINTDAVEDVPNPSARMNWVMINEIYNTGWGLYDHGANEIVSPDFDGLTQSEIDDIVRTELESGSVAMRTNMGIRNRNFTAPSNDNNYDSYTTELANSGSLKIVNNIRSPQRDAYLETYQYWYTEGGGRIDGIGGDYDFINLVEGANFQLDNTDLDFMSSSIADLSTGENLWFANGVHRCNINDIDVTSDVNIRFTDMKDVFERIENIYGKDGSDILWFAPQNEIYEYQFTKELSVLSTVISGSTVEVTCDFSNVPSDFREHALSLVVDADVNINSISYENFDVTSSNIGYGVDNTTALVNVSYNPAYEAAVLQRGRAEVLVSKAEATQQQGDFDLAQDFINTLPNGSYKSGLQTRLDDITIVPDSVVINIDFGSNLGGRPTSGNWNNINQDQGITTSSTGLTSLISSTGDITSIDLEVSRDFSAVQTNSRASDTNVNNPFPFTALRDSWETTPTSTGGVKITGLDPTKVYDFEFCASRGSTDQDTIYTAIGDTTESVFLTTKNNGENDIWETVTITSGIAPDVNDEIEITVEGSVGLVPNSNHQGFLGVIQIIERNP